MGYPIKLLELSFTYFLRIVLLKFNEGIYHYLCSNHIIWFLQTFDTILNVVSNSKFSILAGIVSHI